MKTLLYIRGAPGSGKITVARILEKRLGWKLFWLHDLDAVAKIIGDHRCPRLMDEISRPILQHLLGQGQDIIYVRPSRDRETIEAVRELGGQAGYRFVLVTLAATYGTLRQRIVARPASECRISTEAGLDEYLKARPPALVPGEYIIWTEESNNPEAVADKIYGVLYQ